MKFFQQMNFNIIKKSILPFYILQIFSLFLVLIIDFKSLYLLPNEEILSYLGLCNLHESDFLTIMFKVVSIAFVIFTTVQLFISTIGKIITYISLRIKSLKLMISNMSICLLIVFITRTVIFLITLTLFLKTDHMFSTKEILLYYCYDLMFYESICLVSIFEIEMFASNLLCKLCGIVLLFITFITISIFKITSISIVYFIIFIIVIIIFNISNYRLIKISDFLGNNKKV